MILRELLVILAAGLAAGVSGALMMARLFQKRLLCFSAEEIIGSSGLLQHCRRMSMSVAGSERVLIAQNGPL